MRPDDASLTDIPVQSALAEVQVHAGDLRRTVYGPSVFGTVRVDDPGAVAALHRLRAPEVPRPEAAPAPYPPYPTPAGARVPATVVVVDASAPVPALAIAGAALAVPLPPVG
ncbi:MAG TPA: hypothetical protein VHE35_10585, partial [Kofleriaceae bacterium]|nr:hypothetical protein [Kofleriaceae bacterium]